MNIPVSTPDGSISDLSYRNYDGPLGSPTLRWWVISKHLILQALTKKSLWVLTLLSGWYYIVMVIVLFFVQQIGQGSSQSTQAFDAFMSRLVWKDQFLHGFSFAQLLLMIIALLIGAGAIANDNRANALLVYLSKPCSKLDYMLGKWVGVFLLILAIIGIPTLLFYGYGALSFRDHGFIHDDPWLLLKMFAVLPLSAALHTSLILALSSMFRQGRMAGATYAGIYVLSNVFTHVMAIFWALSQGEVPKIVATLSYFSIDGLQIGLAKAILHTSGTPPFGFQNPGAPITPIPPPGLAPQIGIVVGVTALCMWFVWTRVRAVEVV